MIMVNGMIEQTTDGTQSTVDDIERKIIAGAKLNEKICEFESKGARI